MAVFYFERKQGVIKYQDINTKSTKYYEISFSNYFADREYWARKNPFDSMSSNLFKRRILQQAALPETAGKGLPSTPHSRSRNLWKTTAKGVFCFLALRERIDFNFVVVSHDRRGDGVSTLS
jgi:hypothetical protein